MHTEISHRKFFNRFEVSGNKRDVILLDFIDTQQWKRSRRRDLLNARVQENISRRSLSDDVGSVDGKDLPAGHLPVGHLPAGHLPVTVKNGPMPAGQLPA